VPDRQLDEQQLPRRKERARNSIVIDETQREQQTGLCPWQHVAVFVFACALIVSRRPDLIFHAQFYAEDGHVWYADAYNLGWWHGLLRTWTGYFLTLPRLVASLALLVPLHRVPLLLNLFAVFVQALPANLLLSFRSSEWGSLRFRAFLAAMYLALPNNDEITRSITDANWPLALSAFVLVVASVPRSLAGRVFDIFIMLLCGLSGPFCVFLLPLSIFLVWKHREYWRWVPAGIFAVCCLVQSWTLLFLASTARSHRAFGASPELFARIVGSQVYAGALLGNNALSLMPGPWYSILLACLAIGGTAFVVICSLRSPMAMKLFLILSALLFASSLIAPVEWDHPSVPVWKVYASLAGLRYWFFPTLAFTWSLLFGYRSSNVTIKAVSAILLCLMCIGVIRDWHHPAFPDTHFAESAKRFAAAPDGATVTIPEYPLGWSATLIKHTTGR
jgi:hypothetical protein